VRQGFLSGNNMSESLHYPIAPLGIARAMILTRPGMAWSFCT